MPHNQQEEAVLWKEGELGAPALSSHLDHETGAQDPRAAVSVCRRGSHNSGPSLSLGLLMNSERDIIGMGEYLPQGIVASFEKCVGTCTTTRFSELQVSWPEREHCSPCRVTRQNFQSRQTHWCPQMEPSSPYTDLESEPSASQD